MGNGEGPEWERKWRRERETWKKVRDKPLLGRGTAACDSAQRGTRRPDCEQNDDLYSEYGGKRKHHLIA
jgi:hypothetical protein